MQYRARRNLFYLFCLAFLVLGTGTVLYAQGWRLDTHTWSIKKVGGIFIQSHPRDATISLDGMPVQNGSWLLQRGTFINNLFPKTYTLTLQKEGFLPWTRRIVVAPSLVAEVPNAVLVPNVAEERVAPSSTLAILRTLLRDARVATSTRWDIRVVENPRNSTSTIVFTETQKSTTTTASSSLTLTLESPAMAIAWNNRGILGILQRDGTLLQYNPATHEERKIADDVTHFVWNNDGRKIAAVEHRSLEVFDLERPEEYYRFNIPNIGSAVRAFWYHDDEHLFIIYPEKTIFFDFGDTGLENLIEVAPTRQVAYDYDTNEFSFLLPATTTLRVLKFPK